MREQAFAPAYYFFGDEDFLKESTTRDLVASIVDPSMRVFNCQMLRGDEVSAEALDMALNTSSMLGSRRVIVIRVVSALSRDAKNVVLAYLRRPSSDMVLVLVAPPGERPDPAFAEKSVAMDFQPLASDRVVKWIVHYAKTALGADITPEAASLLQSAVGAELASLAVELDKIVSYAGGGAITETALEVITGIRSGESLGDLLDAVVDRDAAKALTLVPRVLAQPKTTPVLIIMALTTQVLAVAWGVATRDRGTRPTTLEREFFALLRETRVHPWRSWGDASKSWARAVPLWSRRAVDEALELLLASDRTVKETRLSSDTSVIAGLVLGLCTAGARTAA